MVPQLTRSSLHCFFQRHAISHLPTTGSWAAPGVEGLPLGYIHIDLAEVWTDEGKLYLFVAIDRVSKFAFAELHERATRRISGGLPAPAHRARPVHASTPCSPTTAFSSPRHMAAGRVGRDSAAARQSVSAFVPTPLTWPAPSTASTIASRNSIIRGPTAKSNG